MNQASRQVTESTGGHKWPGPTEMRDHEQDRAPRVSVGLPVHNGEDYLEQTLDSLLGQTFGDFELIISDNASTDRTEQICRKYAAKDKRIRYLRNETNIGAAENFNRLFLLSRGEYFKWAAADDVCLPEFLARCVAALDRESGAVLAFTTVIQIDEYGKHLGTVPPVQEAASADPHVRFRRLMRYDHLCEQVFGLIRSSVLRQTNLIEKYTDSDRVLLSHLALFGHFALIPEPLFLNRLHPKSSTRAYPDGRSRMMWFDPSFEGRKVFPFWTEFNGFCRAINQSPLSKGNKARCYLAMITWSRYQRKWLRWDLQYYPKRWIVRHVPGAGVVLARLKMARAKSATGKQNTPAVS
jgi:glycosyltransferase involved in cell wall biosynthesis